MNILQSIISEVELSGYTLEEVFYYSLISNVFVCAALIFILIFLASTLIVCVFNDLFKFIKTKIKKNSEKYNIDNGSYEEDPKQMEVNYEEDIQ